MSNFFIDTWNETIEDVKKLIPAKYKTNILKNKSKIIGVILFLTIIEIIIFIMIWKNIQ